MADTLTSGELFAGVGGLERAMHEVFGSVTVWFAEFDDAPSHVLAERYPGIPNYGDVTAVEFQSVPRVKVMGGGFPCTDVSQAGRMAGLKDGTRSGLWSEYRRAIAAQRPDWVVIENVRGLLTSDGEPWHPELVAADAEWRHWKRVIALIESKIAKWRTNAEYVIRKRGERVRAARLRDRALARREREHGLVQRAIATVLRDLAELGFDAEWTGLRASDIGAPHARFRVFILAWPRERTATHTSRGRSGGGTATS